MFHFGQYWFHIESYREFLINTTGPLVSVRAIELEGSVIMMKFMVFMCECAKNEKRMTCESKYYFLLFVFVFTADDLIVDESDNIYEG